MATFDPAELLPAEREAVGCTARGEWAVLFGRPAEDLVVRAAFLRHLLLGLPTVPAWDGSGLRPWMVQLPGVRICGARIEGALDLADCAGPDGTGLPGLALEECNIGADIDLSNAWLARLSLKGSRIVHVRMRGAKLDGPFDFSGVFYLWQAARIEDEVAWIDAHGCVIRGEVRGAGARLQAPPKRDEVTPGQQRFALRLSAAEVGGGIVLTGGVVAIGGITHHL